MSARLRVYTREPDAASYPAGLALSVHISLIGEDGTERLMNHGHGVLFATGLIDGQDRIDPRSLTRPGILKTGEREWVIAAERCLEHGEPEEIGGLLQAWRTADFCSFDPLGMIPRPEGVFSDTAELPRDIAARVEERWGDPCGWPFRVDPERPEGLPWPAATGFGDPVILFREGKYYFLGTADLRDDIGLYVREGDTLASLFAPGYREYLILDQDLDRGFVQTFWAPEFHEIRGELYILFAVSGRKWGPLCHIMKLKPGGSIIRAEDWTTPVPVTRRDGSPLAGPDGITLDMTCFRTDRLYAVWSYRRHIGTERDTGSMLYIAVLDENDPTRLASEPVLLSRPLYGWENVDHTINNEGPYPLLTGGRVWLAYSGGSANAYTYAVGLLCADAGADLLKPESWKKNSCPFLDFASVPGEWGPGHNSFFRDAEGDWWIACHIETAIDSRLRCPVLHRIGLLPENGKNT